MPDPINLSYSLPFYLAALAAGYGLGSIPFGLILARIAGHGDIRKIGSGNIGATNVLRTGSKWLAALTLLLDGGKGAIAVLVGRAFLGPDIAILAGAGAFLGHLFPIWLGFRGGKGVATAFGLYLALYWPVGLMAVGTWLIVAAISRYSSLSALAAAVLAPLYFFIAERYQMAQFAGFIAILIVVSHRQNIARLLRGTELKIVVKW